MSGQCWTFAIGLLHCGFIPPSSLQNTVYACVGTIFTQVGLGNYGIYLYRPFRDPPLQSRGTSSSEFLDGNSVAARHIPIRARIRYTTRKQVSTRRLVSWGLRLSRLRLSNFPLSYKDPSATVLTQRLTAPRSAFNGWESEYLLFLPRRLAFNLFTFVLLEEVSITLSVY